jgi:superoxide dismutase, Fe-Mn family
MPYTMRPLSCDPARVKGMSERLIVSHYENNYGGAVKRLISSTNNSRSSNSTKPPAF